MKRLPLLLLLASAAAIAASGAYTATDTHELVEIVDGDQYVDSWTPGIEQMIVIGYYTGAIVAECDTTAAQIRARNGNVELRAWQYTAAECTVTDAAGGHAIYVGDMLGNF